MGFSKPEYQSGYPFPSPGDLPNSGIEPRASTLQADSLPTESQRKLKNSGLGSLSLLQQISCHFLLHEHPPNPGIESVSPTLQADSLSTESSRNCQAPLSMEFSKQEYWSGLSFLPPKDLPDPGFKPACISCTGWQILYGLSHQGSPLSIYLILITI